MTIYLKSRQFFKTISIQSAQLPTRYIQAAIQGIMID